MVNWYRWAYDPGWAARSRSAIAWGILLVGCLRAIMSLLYRQKPSASLWGLFCIAITFSAAEKPIRMAE